MFPIDYTLINKFQPVILYLCLESQQPSIWQTKENTFTNRREIYHFLGALSIERDHNCYTSKGEARPPHASVKNLDPKLVSSDLLKYSNYNAYHVLLSLPKEKYVAYNIATFAAATPIFW